MSARVQPDSLESTLRAFVEAAVEAKLASLGIATTMAVVYSTERPELYPPGRRSRRAARDAIRVVPGAEHIGTVYAVSRAAYEAHHAKHVRPPTVRLLPALAADDEAGVGAALEAAGLRSTRRTA